MCNGSYSLHGVGTEIRMGTIENNGSLSLCSAYSIIYKTHHFPVPVPVSVPCSVNEPLAKLSVQNQRSMSTEICVFLKENHLPQWRSGKSSLCGGCCWTLCWTCWCRHLLLVSYSSKRGWGRRWYGGVQRGVVLFSSWQQLSLSICLWISALTPSIHHVLALYVVLCRIWNLLQSEVLIK